jgi:hypothetical protein
MSADRRERPRAVLAALVLGTAAACGGGGGGGGESIPSPANLAIDPDSGYSGHATPVVITGDNFLARSTGSGLDSRHEAWLGSTPLEHVTWIDSHTLHADVPAGLPAGTSTLRVRNAYGREGTLADAFTVLTSPGGALAVTSVVVTPAAVNVGQTATVTATVASAGDAAVTNVIPSLPQSLTSPDGGAASVTDGPSPSSVATLAPNASTTFTWTVQATAAGQVDELGATVPLALPVTASGDDSFSGEVVQADTREGQLVVDEPAGLIATVVAGRTTVDVGQPVPVTFSVTNGGTASANLNPPVPSASLAVAGGGSGSASCTAPSPAGVTTVGAHASRVFTWACTASAAGVLTLSGQVTGTDANTGGPLSATPTAADTAAVQTPAALSATLSIQGNPAAVNVGQTLTVRLTVSDGGTASAHVTGVTPAFGDAASCSAAAPDPPAAVPGGGSVQFSWTCTPAAPGTLSLGATISGTDDNTAGALTATSNVVNVLVQLPASLVGVTSASRSTADTGQVVGVTLRLVNGSGVAANINAVAPQVLPASTAQATCGAAAEPLPIVLAGGASTTFTWSCTPSAAGALVLGATVTAADANSPTTAVPVTITTATVTVQAPASVAVTSLVVDRSTVDTGQGAVVSLSLRNSGGADARVTITPTAAPTGPSCTPAPSAAQILAGGGGTLGVSWTCTSASAGAFAYGATISAVDVNSGATTTPAATAVPVTVQTPAALTGALSLPRATLDTSQGVTVTLTITNHGGASASVSAVAPGVTAGSGAVSCPAGPSQTLPLSVPGGGAVSLTWVCTGTSPGTASLLAGVTARDENDGGAVNATAAPLGVTVQVPAALTATLVADRSTLGVTQSVNLTLTVQNVGGGSATLTAITPTPASGAVTCPAAPVEALGTIAGGGSATLHWSCTGAAAGTPTLGATVAASAVNTGGGLAPVVTGVPVTVQAAAALAATVAASAGAVRTGQTVGVTLTLRNTGGATAHVTGVSSAVAGVAGTCTPPSATAFDLAAGASRDVTWSCTLTAAGSGALGAAVVATDANTAARVDPTVVPAAVAVEAPLAAALLASPVVVDGGQAVGVTLTLTNDGAVGASARVSAVAASITGVSGTCTAPAPAPPFDVAGGGAAHAVTVTWSCTPASGATGTASLGAAVTAADPVSAVDLSPTAVAPATVTVQSPAQLTAALTPIAGPAGPVTFTVMLTNIGGATARVTRADFLGTNGAAARDGAAAARGALPDIVGGTVGQVSWGPCTATGALADAATVQVTVEATDLNSGLGAGPTPAVISQAYTLQ